ncbi:hypothetical protein IV203_010166 [Nitzschia inconspicua]|uniref:Uncharacterized protein n=1 Tax=Nitzschia inconspicua TaxID=303405 RepID=A0A9K3KX40_9STRA|nr:hypothetical protein IV203_010166 [Nitzschia inconspicua]
MMSFCSPRIKFHLHFSEKRTESEVFYYDLRSPITSIYDHVLKTSANTNKHSLITHQHYSRQGPTASNIPSFNSSFRKVVSRPHKTTMTTSSIHQQSQSSPPRITATSTNYSSELFLPFGSLMNQSTIYRRHEARLARSYALRDDPRPAFLRVLSGLPLTHIIVPPYQPRQSGDNELRNENSSKIQKLLGDYSEETVFSTVDDNQQVVGRHSHNVSSLSIPYQPLQAMVAAGAGAIAGEFLVGGHFRKKTPVFSSLFPHNNNNVMVRGHAAATDSSLGFQLLKTHQSRPTAGLAVSTTKPSTIIFISASITSLLFGTKVAVTQYLSPNGGNEDTITALLSSAMAGGVTGMIRLATNPSQRPAAASNIPTLWMQTTATTSSSLVTRHVLAATLYFSTYDTLSQTSDENKNAFSTPRILAAGAVAGMVQATVFQASQGSLYVAKMALRSAPLHAMIFYAYESMKLATAA